MARVDRLPSVPLIASDPYFSIWMPADTMTQTDSTHWRGSVKALRGTMTVDGDIRPRMNGFTIELDGLHTGWHGQMAQKPLCHAGDHITIDWGYLYLASRGAVAAVGDGLVMDWSGTLQGEQQLRAIIAYDDIASINYFGDLCKAWYRRHGAQITDAIRTADSRFDEIIRRCGALDERVLGDAAAIGADYTKSDWLCWTAALADDPEVRTALLAPLAKMLRESASRVPFSDWYDTKTGCYRAFIARSVQGGVFALLLR